VAGGQFAGDLADGVIKPNLPADYAPSGLWDSLLGQKVPDTGDPEAAKKLIAESGQTMKTLQYDYPQTDANDKLAASVVGSLAKAGIKVKPNPIEAGQFYGIVLDPAKEGHLVWASWGPDWSNASTVIPEVFTPNGGFNLSQVGSASGRDGLVYLWAPFGSWPYGDLFVRP
jgi:peptide/nickel transport system substrate-binding protein